MTGATRESFTLPNIVIFDSSPSSSTFSSNNSIVIPCQDGLQKLTGHVKRGRPRKERQPSPDGDCNGESQIDGVSSKSNFSFVTYTASPQNAGPNIQKLIRKRVMLTYRRREREQKRISELTETSKFICITERPLVESKKEYIKTFRQHIADDCMRSASPMTSSDMLREITTVEPFDVFPIRIEPYMLDLLNSYTTSIHDTMYTIEKFVGVNTAKDYWLPTAFQDAALLHAFLFCAGEHGTISQGRTEGPIAVIHLRKAIQIVNERLRESMPNITDATIAVVCTFAHMEILNGNHDNWMVHMRGLKQMLQQRGGIQNYESKRLVRSKIHRADLSGSISDLRSPLIEPVVVVLPAIPRYNQMTTTPATGFDGITNSTRIDDTLARILCQVEDITFHLNRFYSHKTQIHPLILREAINSAQYTLLSLKPQQNSTTHNNSMNEMLRLALLMYLVTLLNEVPPGVPLYDTLGARLKATLVETAQNGGLNLEFSLWIMFMAASLVEDPDTKEFYTSSATEIIERLGVPSWGSVETLFSSFPWVEHIHRRTFSSVWNALSINGSSGVCHT